MHPFLVPIEQGVPNWEDVGPNWIETVTVPDSLLALQESITTIDILEEEHDTFSPVSVPLQSLKPREKKKNRLSMGPSIFGSSSSEKRKSTPTPISRGKSDEIVQKRKNRKSLSSAVIRFSSSKEPKPVPRPTPLPVQAPTDIGNLASQLIVVVWQWQNKTKWEDHDPETCLIMEKAYQSDQRTLKLNHGIFSSDPVFIEFPNTQIHETTKYKRFIQRIDPSEPVHWYFEDVPFWCRYDEETNRSIEDSFQQLHQLIHLTTGEYAGLALTIQH